MNDKLYYNDAKAHHIILAITFTVLALALWMPFIQGLYDVFNQTSVFIVAIGGSIISVIEWQRAFAWVFKGE